MICVCIITEKTRAGFRSPPSQVFTFHFGLPTIFGNTHFDWNFHWPIFRNDEWTSKNQKDWGDSTALRGPWKKSKADHLGQIHPRKTNMEPKNGGFGRWSSFSNRWFSGSMLVFRGVILGGIGVPPLFLPWSSRSTSRSWTTLKATPRGFRGIVRGCCMDG